jgi:hypothetical protein
MIGQRALNFRRNKRSAVGSTVCAQKQGDAGMDMLPLNSFTHRCGIEAENEPADRASGNEVNELTCHRKWILANQKAFRSLLR